MTVQINGKPLADFDQPIGMMTDCHRRIEHFLSVLQRVAERYGGRPLDEAGRRAVRAAQAYFANAAPKHTADEEVSLFPRVLDSGSLDPETLRVMRELERDHRDAERLHERVDQQCERWLASDQGLPADESAALASDLDRLGKLYAQHIAVEEQRLFPAAAAALNQDQLRAVGEEMRRRRHA